jgi:hypothetical protein
MATLLKLTGALLIFSCAVQTYAQSNQDHDDAVCAQAAKLPNPPSDLPPADASIPEHCDAWDMYYGEGQPMDVRGARYCAYSNLNVDGSMENGVEAPAVLAMIYANGRGVTPDLHLAIKFACQIKEGWGDNTYLVKMLEAKEQQGTTRVDLDVCDNPTGRQMNYACLIRDQTRANNAVSTAEERFDSGSNEAQHDTFEELREARQGFLYAHRAEQPTGTVGIAQDDIFEDTQTESAWAQMLADLANGKLPHFTKAQFKQADADLNDEYRDARQRTAGCASQFCTSSDQVLQAERQWLVYREAWVSYGKLRWPQVSPDTWRTLLTIERTKMLRDIE